MSSTHKYDRSLPPPRASTILTLEAESTLPSITPKTQLEFAQNGSIVIALFTFYLIAREIRLILQILFATDITQVNNNDEKQTK